MSDGTTGNVGPDATLAAALGGVASLRERAAAATDAEARRLLAEGLEELATAFEQLRASQEELRAADRKKDEFLAVLAHELRSPLASVRTAVALLRARPNLGEGAEHPLGVIDRQARRIGDLVSDLLDVSRISQGKLSLHPETLDLGDACRGAVDAVRPPAAGPVVTVEAAAEGVSVRADPVRLDQVLTNLLTNAIKYTDVGGTVVVRVEREADRAVVRVRDSGVGIAADVLPRVFNLFVQAAPDRSQGGLGIGLHLVKRLAELHGGTAEAHSDGPGRGSEFVVRLPAVTGS